MGINPWFSTQLGDAKAADLERAAAHARLVVEARRSKVGARGTQHRMRRAVSRRVGGVLIAAGARLAGPELARSRLRDV